MNEALVVVLSSRPLGATREHSWDNVGRIDPDRGNNEGKPVCGVPTHHYSSLYPGGTTPLPHEIHPHGESYGDWILSVKVFLNLYARTIISTKWHHSANHARYKREGH